MYVYPYSCVVEFANARNIVISALIVKRSRKIWKTEIHKIKVLVVIKGTEKYKK